MSIEKTAFGKTPDGDDIFLFSIKNANEMSVKLTNFGAIIVSIFVEGENGQFDDIVLGYDDLEGYRENIPFFGSTIGRNSNRIAGSSFTINGSEYHLDKNEGENNLHGGFDGYHKRVWTYEVMDEKEPSVTFNLFSPHGDQGFPGNLDVSVTYTLTADNELKIDYHAVSDQDTIVNLTNHSYFNLAGHDAGDILTHKLWIDADAFTPVSSPKSIPTGECMAVNGTPMDFRKEKEIGKDIESEYEQIQFGGGFDHNWVLNTERGTVKKIACLTDEKSKRMMEVYTDLPGVQFYSGNVLSGVQGKGGATYNKRCGLCLETQYFPDAVHHANFETPFLKVGETYRTQTIYKFSVKG